ncbi:MAG: response regulator [Pegethrix bostrychoides GSE-TBD4-15B]|uniref:Response regulator n=1 Tax=Pegethrix bostrychoides GSE-TBD4-15B TaxID=2839662 RepID=A0A951U5F3_9CYAN|nr:response regulator [Pegethrix bostrychoides GSE-TBD4-15B]
MDILTVDNDCDTRELYKIVFEDYGANVVTAGSVIAGMEALDSQAFDAVICEIRFAGESVYPLIQKLRFMDQISGRTTPILVTSTCPSAELTRHLTVKVEAYLLKPIALSHLVEAVWNTVFWSKITHPSGILELGYKSKSEQEWALLNIA